MASKSGSNNRQRSEIVPVRMLPSERKTLERAAESAGKPLSTLLRECAIAMHGDDLLALQA